MNINAVDLGVRTVEKTDARPRSQGRNDGAFLSNMHQASKQLEQNGMNAQPKDRNVLKDIVNDAVSEAAMKAAAEMSAINADKGVQANPNDVGQATALNGLKGTSLIEIIRSLLAGQADQSILLQDAKDMDDAAMAAMATVMQTPQAFLGQPQPTAAPVEDVPAQTVQQGMNALSVLEAAGIPEQVLREALIAAGQQADAGPIAQEPAQDAAFAEQVLAQIKQAVTNLEAEHSVNTPVQQPPEQEATEAVHPRGYIENKKQEKPIVPVQASDAHPIATGEARPRFMPISVEMQQDAPAPREAQQALFEGIVEQVRSAVTQERSELFVQLKPDTLGGLSIRLVMTEEGLHAQVRTSNQHLQTLVSAEIQDLTASLRDKGIQIVQMDVVYDHMAGNQHLSQQRQQFSGGENQNGGTRRMRALDEVAGTSYEAAYESMALESGIADEGVEYSA